MQRMPLSAALAALLLWSCGEGLPGEPGPAPSAPTQEEKGEAPVEEETKPAVLPLAISPRLSSGGALTVLSLDPEAALTEAPSRVEPGTLMVEVPLQPGEVVAVSQVSLDGTFAAATVARGGCPLPERPASPATLHVPAEYPTLQSAVDAARPGDTVKVAPGVYTEAVRLKSGVALVGSGARETVLDAQGQAMNLVDFTGAAGATLAGFTLRGVGPAEACATPEDPFACEGGQYRAAVYASAKADPEECPGTSAFITHNVFADNYIALMPAAGAVAIVRNNAFVTNVHALAANHLQAVGAVTQNVFWGNAQTGVGVPGGQLDVVNNVIAGSAQALRQESLMDGKVRCNLFFMNGADDAWPEADGNAHADPLFEDPFALDFRLKPGSPARDAGCLAGADPDGSPADIGLHGGPLGAW